MLVHALTHRNVRPGDLTQSEVSVIDDLQGILASSYLPGLFGELNRKQGLLDSVKPRGEDVFDAFEALRLRYEDLVRELAHPVVEVLQKGGDLRAVLAPHLSNLAGAGLDTADLVFFAALGIDARPPSRGLGNGFRPTPVRRLLQIADALQIGPRHRVAFPGCGPAADVALLAYVTGAECIGLEGDEYLAERGRVTLSQAAPLGRSSIIRMDVLAVDPPAADAYIIYEPVGVEAVPELVRRIEKVSQGRKVQAACYKGFESSAHAALAFNRSMVFRNSMSSRDGSVSVYRNY